MFYKCLLTILFHILVVYGHNNLGLWLSNDKNNFVLNSKNNNIYILFNNSVHNSIILGHINCTNM